MPDPRSEAETGLLWVTFDDEGSSHVRTTRHEEGIFLAAEESHVFHLLLEGFV